LVKDTTADPSEFPGSHSGTAPLIHEAVSVAILEDEGTELYLKRPGQFTQ